MSDLGRVSLCYNFDIICVFLLEHTVFLIFHFLYWLYKISLTKLNGGILNHNFDKFNGKYTPNLFFSFWREINGNVLTCVSLRILCTGYLCAKLNNIIYECLFDLEMFTDSFLKTQGPLCATGFRCFNINYCAPSLTCCL